MTTTAQPASAAPIAQAAPVTIPVASSSFQYQPPKSEASPDELAEFTTLLNDSIGEIADEYNPQPEVGEAPTESTAESAAESPAAEVGADEAPAAEDPAVARGMQQLIQREVQLQQRQQALEAREASHAALQAELTKLRAAVPSQQLVEQFDTSPTEAFKAMGKDPETMVRLMVAEQLHAKGQPVPPELQKFVERAADQRRIAALEQRLAAQSAQAQNSQFVTAINNGAHEYVKQFATDTKATAAHPALAAMVSDPSQLHAEIMYEIRSDASARIAQGDTNGDPITYQEAAKRAEARLSRYKTVFTKQLAEAPTKQAGGKPTTHTPPAQKPPTRPLKPWEAANTSLDAAINEATREFHSQEAKRLARR
jgi:hypothetical protein